MKTATIEINGLLSALISRCNWRHCGDCSSGSDKEPASGEKSGKEKPQEFAGSRLVASR